METRPRLLGLVLLQLLAAAATQEGARQDYKHGRQGPELQDKTSSCSWKCLLFTLQWPGGFCQSLDETLCSIPPGVDTWTIHGLWPLRAKHCCSCWPMFRSDVQELEAELTEHWPSLVTNKTSFHFWTDEWRKHGVCAAACVDGMNSPQKYFQVCLKLRGRFDVHKLLEDAGVAPSCERPYKVAEVHSVLAPHLGDTLEIQCVTDDEGREVWFQVKIPLTRNLTVGCDHREEDPALGSSPGRGFSPGHPCPARVPFYYFPIDHQRPRRPCG